ncbi:MAG: RdgB/HAM1 family non-canonical purine NTP pyrophosphatase, partial [Ottowia sp.]|nr:RdgB/HAM1 family non-canonical purine NTP pyrophosphatase [Ottowia sp.]
NNAGKLHELSQLLMPLDITVIPQSALNIPPSEEPFLSFVENALFKARHTAQASGLPTLADDSGLCVPALNGAPGIYSARYAGDTARDSDNNIKLVNALQDKIYRPARYVCVLVWMRHASDPLPLIAQGIWEGEIIDDPRGHNGFGYDPHFFIPSLGCTAAELSSEHKNKISHRAQAMHALLTALHQTNDSNYSH